MGVILEMRNKTCFKQVSVTLPLYKKIFDTGTMPLFQMLIRQKSLDLNLNSSQPGHKVYNYPEQAIEETLFLTYPS